MYHVMLGRFGQRFANIDDAMECFARYCDLAYGHARYRDPKIDDVTLEYDGRVMLTYRPGTCARSDDS